MLTENHLGPGSIPVDWLILEAEPVGEVASFFDVVQSIVELGGGLVAEVFNKRACFLKMACSSSADLFLNSALLGSSKVRVRRHECVTR
jgi:hypothetical protein